MSVRYTIIHEPLLNSVRSLHLTYKVNGNAIGGVGELNPSSLQLGLAIEGELNTYTSPPSFL